MSINKISSLKVSEQFKRLAVKLATHQFTQDYNLREFSFTLLKKIDTMPKLYT